MLRLCYEQKLYRLPQRPQHMAKPQNVESRRPLKNPRVLGCAHTLSLNVLIGARHAVRLQVDPSAYWNKNKSEWWNTGVLGCWSIGYCFFRLRRSRL